MQDCRGQGAGILHNFRPEAESKQKQRGQARENKHRNQRHSPHMERHGMECGKDGDKKPGGVGIGDSDQPEPPGEQIRRQRDRHGEFRRALRMVRGERLQIRLDYHAEHEEKRHAELHNGRGGRMYILRHHRSARGRGRQTAGKRAGSLQSAEHHKHIE